MSHLDLKQWLEQSSKWAFIEDGLSNPHFLLDFMKYQDQAVQLPSSQKCGLECSDLVLSLQQNKILAKKEEREIDIDGLCQRWESWDWIKRSAESTTLL